MTLAVRLCQWLASDATAALCATLAILVIVHLAKKVRAMRLLPPGPQGYPILGILPMIKKEFHLMLFDLSKMYGHIFSLKMGSQTVVVLSDFETIKKAFRSRDFVARPKSELSTLLNGYGKSLLYFPLLKLVVNAPFVLAGIINAEGALWKSNRRYLINQKLGMRHWGQGMEQIEQCVQREVTCLVQALLQEHELVPVNPAPLFNCAVANVICSMIMSVRFRHDDPKFQRFMFLFDDGFRLFASTGAACFIPVLRYLPGVQSTFGKLRANREEMLTFVREIITEHKQSLDPDHPRDLIDTYLVHMQENARTEDLFHGFEAEQQMEQVVLDLFSAGVETLKTSLLWSMVFMLHNPEVKRKVQQELDSVVGSDRLPQIDDMQHTPYTRATILEVLRRSSVVPMGTTHATDRYCGS
jgi:26-hydroxylase